MAELVAYVGGKLSCDLRVLMGMCYELYLGEVWVVIVAVLFVNLMVL